MAEFHLLRPWLLALWLLLPLLYWLWRRSHRALGQWQKLLPPHLHGAMLDNEQQSAKSANPFALLLGVAIAIFALAGPAWDKTAVPLYQANVGRVLVLDLSDSMWATDLSPNRLSQARFKATDLLRQATEGEIGLIAYAGDAFVLAPLTEDRATLLNQLPHLTPDLMPVKGSNLPKALTQAEQLLQEAGYQQGQILLLTDGVNAEHLAPVLAFAEQSPWQLDILALGSEQGSPMKRPNGELIRDHNDEIAIARTDFAQLSQLTRASGGIMVPHRSDDADINALLAQLSALTQDKTDAEQSHEQWHDRGGQVLLLALLPFAFALRRQALLSLLPLLLFTAPSSEAAWWKNDDQNGKALFDQGQYAEAAETFADPSWQGSAHYQAGDYQQALNAFEQSQAPQSLYNQGNALTQLGQFEQAAERYREHLARFPNDAKAQNNLKYVEEQAQQQQQNQSQGQQGNSDQQQGENGQQGESGSQNDQQGGDDSQGQSEQQSEDQSQPQGNSGSSSGSEQNPTPPSQTDNSPEQNADSTEHSDPPSQEGSEPNDAQASGEQQAAEDKNHSAQQNGDEEQAESNAPEGSANTEQNPAELAQAGSENSTPSAEQEAAQQQLERMLRQVPDNPALLLQNKMQLEYQRRLQRGELLREQTQW